MKTTFYRLSTLPFQHRFITGISAFTLTMLLAACGSGSSSNDAPGSGSATDGKIGDITYSASGSVVFTNDPGCGTSTRSMTNWGTGVVSRINGKYAMTTVRNKSFGPGNGCYGFDQTDSQPLTCVTVKGNLVCRADNTSYNYTFTINLTNGSGTIKYQHHYLEDGKNHVGESNGTISSANWSKP